MPGLLEPLVHLLLHQLPHRVAIGLDHHATLDVAVVRHIVLDDHVRIPLGKILGTAGDMLYELIFVLCHATLRSSNLIVMIWDGLRSPA